ASSTTTAMPASPSTAWTQEIATGSLLRISSFMPRPVRICRLDPPGLPPMLVGAAEAVNKRGRSVAVIVSLDSDRDKGRGPSLARINALVADDLRRVNELIMLR